MNFVVFWRKFFELKILIFHNINFEVVLVRKDITFKFLDGNNCCSVIFQIVYDVRFIDLGVFSVIRKTNSQFYNFFELYVFNMKAKTIKLCSFSKFSWFDHQRLGRQHSVLTVRQKNSIFSSFTIKLIVSSHLFNLLFFSSYCLILELFNLIYFFINIFFINYFTFIVCLVCNDFMTFNDS